MEIMRTDGISKTAVWRWQSGSYPGEWGGERVVFTGGGEPGYYAADEDDRVLIGRETAQPIDAILAHFDAAEVVVPPLLVEGVPS